MVTSCSFVIDISFFNNRFKYTYFRNIVHNFINFTLKLRAKRPNRFTFYSITVRRWVIDAFGLAVCRNVTCAKHECRMPMSVLQAVHTAYDQSHVACLVSSNDNECAPTCTNRTPVQRFHPFMTRLCGSHLVSTLRVYSVQRIESIQTQFLLDALPRFPWWDRHHRPHYEHRCKMLGMNDCLSRLLAPRLVSNTNYGLTKPTAHLIRLANANIKLIADSNNKHILCTKLRRMYASEIRLRFWSRRRLIRFKPYLTSASLFQWFIKFSHYVLL